MIKTVNSSAQLGDPRDEQRPARTPSKSAGKARDSMPASSEEPDVRLVIERDEEHDVLIYKLIDRSTGKTISTVSRDELMKISAQPSYTAGAVINTKA